jgi:uncharacterized protein
VSGLSPAVARAVVRWREQHGAFQNRQQLLEVSGLGPKTFEQSAGFLRIRGGDNPLDLTGVHPETYPVVEQIIVKTGKPIDQLMGRAELLKGLKPEQFATEGNSAPSPSRTSWPSWKSPAATRAPTLQGGALQRRRGRHRRPAGRHGAGRHGEQRRRSSAPSWTWACTRTGWCTSASWPTSSSSDAREVVKTGQIVKVKVLEVDVARKRISLTMKLDAQRPRARDGPRENRFESAPRGSKGPAGGAGRGGRQPAATAMASAFEKLKGTQRVVKVPRSWCMAVSFLRWQTPADDRVVATCVRIRRPHFKSETLWGR